MRETANEQSNQKTATLPDRNAILMTGKFVQRKELDRFCELGIDSLLDGRIAEHYEFSLGVLAAIDAMARGTIPFVDHPADVIQIMWFDVNNITDEPTMITDIMRIEHDR